MDAALVACRQVPSLSSVRSRRTTNVADVDESSGLTAIFSSGTIVPSRRLPRSHLISPASVRALTASSGRLL